MSVPIKSYKNRLTKNKFCSIKEVMTSQEEEKVYMKIMASQESQHVYQLPNIELHASTLDKSQEKDNHKELGILRRNSKKAEEMTKSQKICVCWLASLLALALSVAGIALLLSIHFGIQNAMMDSCLSQSNSTETNQPSNSNNQTAEFQITLSQLAHFQTNISASQFNSLQSLLNHSNNQIAELQMTLSRVMQFQLDTSASQISSLQSLLNYSNDQIAELQAQQSTLIQQVSSILAKVIEADNKLSAVIRRFGLLFSCSDLPPDAPSGTYNITKNDGTSVQVYCDMNRTSCSCNTTGGWMRVANIDMTDPNQNCPAGFRLVTRTSAPLRTCGRPGPAGCVSTSFQTYGVKYVHVCGRVIGYQDGTPDAFGQYANTPGGTAIDSVYMDGVSLTHGQSPRQHIWTFAGAADETARNFILANVCPCTQPDILYAGTIPSFVGQDYFCDTGSREAVGSIFYHNDSLWDGQGCGGNSTCCEFNNPPWFCRQLPRPTTDDIELRICGDEDTDNEDTPIEQVQIYIR